MQTRADFEFQIHVIACTDILVGVDGAGLEWLFFMKQKKGLLDLAWPQYHWNFFVTGLCCACVANWTHTSVHLL